ncbi:hypothetical protein AB0K40_12215 [Nonomuraea bangladeshensis]|uniref:MmyB-like transcription regulator ligand binding domain-containing protein n=1 Tax=Nonomuraea bangladeshensis TaxID=404385 RepID=A0ABV3H139_9ACTN
MIAEPQHHGHPRPGARHAGRRHRQRPRPGAQRACRRRALRQEAGRQTGRQAADPSGGGHEHFRHHVVGDLTLTYESMDLRAEPGLSMTIYTAEPGSPSEDALRLLASWSAPQEHPERPQDTGHPRTGRP